MCMQNVTPWPKDKRKPTTGWKVFTLCLGTLRAFGNDSEIYKRGRWYVAKHQPSGDRVSLTYKAGFHTFLLKRDAQIWCGGLADYCVLKVRVQGVQFVGVTPGWRLPAFTSDQMMIPAKRKTKRGKILCA